MNKLIGTVTGGIATFTVDILAAANEATQELEGSIVWDDYEYLEREGDKNIQIYGMDGNDKVSYRLVIDVHENGEIWTKEQEAPLYTTCTNTLCCGVCGIYTTGDCFCKTVGSGCEEGFCEKRTFGWIGTLSDVCISYY